MCGSDGPFQGAPFLTDNLMCKRNRLVSNESAIWLADKQSPAYEDRFWAIRDVRTATMFGQYVTKETQDFMACIRQPA